MVATQVFPTLGSTCTLRFRTKSNFFPLGIIERDKEGFQIFPYGFSFIGWKINRVASRRLQRVAGRFFSSRTSDLGCLFMNIVNRLSNNDDRSGRAVVASQARLARLRMRVSW
jgi:hypothetical protein